METGYPAGYRISKKAGYRCNPSKERQRMLNSASRMRVSSSMPTPRLSAWPTSASWESASRTFQGIHCAQAWLQYFGSESAPFWALGPESDIPINSIHGSDLEKSDMKVLNTPTGSVIKIDQIQIWIGSNKNRSRIRPP